MTAQLAGRHGGFKMKTERWDEEGGSQGEGVGSGGKSGVWGAGGGRQMTQVMTTSR